MFPILLKEFNSYLQRPYQFIIISLFLIATGLLYVGVLRRVAGVAGFADADLCS